jgi:enolase-phosphatase E1
VIALAARGIGAVLLDIEGTTTPIAFVHDVLFPYARARLPAFVERELATPAVADAAARLAFEHAEDAARGEEPPAWRDDPPAARAASVASYCAWLMDRDRKSTGLKRLQGYIWEAGYQAGELRGQVFPDVAPAIRRWRDAGLQAAIYSSGSELAQRRLFESTPAGDLTPLLSAFFDTTIGSKLAPESYARIAARLGFAPAAVLFVSDVTRELHAARAAGLAVVLARRPGNAPQADATAFDQLTSFDDLV